MVYYKFTDVPEECAAPIYDSELHTALREPKIQRC
jgi:hypothetical protein